MHPTKTNIMSPSRNHSYFQANTTYSLKNQRQYSIFTELSLEIEGKEYVPDICVYPKTKLNRRKDVLRMTEMPLLAIELLSPTQGTKEITDKFEIFFAAGIKSCWLIEPLIGTVTVYNSPESSQTFREGDMLEDKITGIKISVQEIFDEE